MLFMKLRGLTWCYRPSCCHMSKSHMSGGCRFNPLNIQMLSESLHKQIFDNNANIGISKDNINDSMKHLESHKLWGKYADIIPEVDFVLPKLKGKNIEEHFRILALSQTKDYRELGDHMADIEVPLIPERWELRRGWTRYGRDGSVTRVDEPSESAIVFDIETLINEGHYPTMATAVSSQAWYSWCSERVDTDKFSLHPSIDDLIPLENNLNGKNKSKPRLVIGHNVGFDRSFVKEQYYIKGSRLRFMDTMSLHIAISGFTSFQRVLYQAKKSENSRQEVVQQWRQRPQAEGASEEWMREGSMNNLGDVYAFHCHGSPLDKSSRDVFVSGCMADVRERFQELMTYCAKDVWATHAVFKKLWPLFFQRFPHPVTLAGMLEMGTAYLPVNANWEGYISEANSTYDDLQREMKLSLMKLANETCQLLHDNKYLDDPWLWDLDWTVKDIKIKAAKIAKKQRVPSNSDTSKEQQTPDESTVLIDENHEKDDCDDLQEIPQVVQKVLDSAVNLPKRKPHLAGYPNWYRDLCPKPPLTKDDDIMDSLSIEESDWLPGPSLLTTQLRITPKLLRLTWDGNPVQYNDTYGWGYLQGGREDNHQMILEDEFHPGPVFPTESLYAFQGLDTSSVTATETMTAEEWENTFWKGSYITDRDSMEPGEVRKHWSERGVRASANLKRSARSLSCDDVSVPGCWFCQIPHKDGGGKRVGNPLAKDFQSKLEDGTLKAWSGASADRALQISKVCSYWKNNQDRIDSLMYVYLKKNELPRPVTRNADYDTDMTVGAIVPRVVVAGTVTRRAVEPTWLTASNAYVDRIGSELKSMIQSPPGYHFVGADVDSQELWIAALLGDAHFNKMHGCTALGWMTLQGKKSAGTDLHSVTANAVGISRDHAKVFNYGRIYGAGQRFAERLLMQFNHRLTKHNARTKAVKLYSMTKGDKNKKTGKWEGGSESEMFNQLEKIANMPQPKTPVLGCSITKSLEPDLVQSDFITSRINWVVQSSAVDYLHLMLVSMRWLVDEFGLDARFSISIHDEVRYLVQSDDRYRTALALQITNLLTRAMFTHSVGIQDLPQSVAFFSAVDIDTCLRKEVTMDCVTPSNPHGMHRGYGIEQGLPHEIYPDSLSRLSSCMFYPGTALFLDEEFESFLSISSISDGEALDIYEILKKTSGSLKKQKLKVTCDENNTMVKSQMKIR